MLLQFAYYERILLISRRTNFINKKFEIIRTSKRVLCMNIIYLNLVGAWISLSLVSLDHTHNVMSSDKYPNRTVSFTVKKHFTRINKNL